MSIKAELATNGYAIVENVLSPDEIELAKEYCPRHLGVNLLWRSIFNELTQLNRKCV
jgi:hypothetical protein